MPQMPSDSSAAAGTPGAAAPASPPDWSAIADDVHCPMCDYNLRGLIDPRCPECGYRFDWPDILDPRRRLHPYLFEHHPERNLSSFCRTALGGWRAGRFWRSIHPSQPSCPRRLVLYWGLTAGCYLFGVASLVVSLAVMVAAENRMYQASIIRMYTAPTTTQATVEAAWMTQQAGSVQAYAQRQYPTSIPRILMHVCTGRSTPGPGTEFWVVALLPIAWPWLTFGILILFRLSMRRHRMKAVHTLRCVLYGSDAVFWVGACLLASSVVQITLITSGVRFGPTGLPYPPSACGPAILAAVLVGTFRLWRAYALYMRFDHPLATVIASQLILALLLLNVIALGSIWTSPLR